MAAEDGRALHPAYREGWEQGYMAGFRKGRAEGLAQRAGPRTRAARRQEARQVRALRAWLLAPYSPEAAARPGEEAAC